MAPIIALSQSQLQGNRCCGKSTRSAARSIRIGPAAWPVAPAPRLQRRAYAVVCSAEVFGAPKINLELPTPDIQQAIELTVFRRARGGNVILVSEVDPASAAYAAGVRPGQQLLALSDPIRAGEVWELNSLASLKYVRQAVSMRARETITLKLSADPVPEWAQALAAAGLESPAEGAGAGSSAAGALTKAQRDAVLGQLERMQEAAVAQKQSERDRKLAVRKAYEEENSQRADTKPLFAAAAFSLILLLPLGILGLAFTTGFMDSLGAGRVF